MSDYGTNYDYGMSFYKDDGEATQSLLAVEPVMLATWENRAFYFSHRSAVTGPREYRLGEFLKYGKFRDEFIKGT